PGAPENRGQPERNRQSLRMDQVVKRGAQLYIYQVTKHKDVGNQKQCSEKPPLISLYAVDGEGARKDCRTLRMKQPLGSCDHLAVPPTVIRSSLRVGMPTPTGTDWPSLPQVPTPSSSSRSLPTMETLVSASGPLPIRLQFLSGAVTFPSSIR